MRKVKLVWLLVFVIAAVAVIAACKKPAEQPPADDPNIITKMVINSPGNVNKINCGEKLKLSVTISPDTIADKSVTWSIIADEDLTGTLISADGEIDAGWTPGTITVQAKSVQDKSKLVTKSFNIVKVVDPDDVVFDASSPVMSAFSAAGSNYALTKQGDKVSVVFEGVLGGSYQNIMSNVSSYTLDYSVLRLRIQNTGSESITFSIKAEDTAQFAASASSFRLKAGDTWDFYYEFDVSKFAKQGHITYPTDAVASGIINKIVIFTDSAYNGAAASETFAGQFILWNAGFQTKAQLDADTPEWPEPGDDIPGEVNTNHITIAPKEGVPGTLTVNYKVEGNVNYDVPLYSVSPAVDHVGFADRGSYTHITLKILNLAIAAGENDNTKLTFQYRTNAGWAGWQTVNAGNTKDIDYAVTAVNQRLSLQIVAQAVAVAEGSFEIQVGYDNLISSHMTLTPSGNDNEYTAEYYSKRNEQANTGVPYVLPFTSLAQPTKQPVSVSITITGMDGYKNGAVQASPLIQAVFQSGPNEWDRAGWASLTTNGAANTLSISSGYVALHIVGTGESSGRDGNVYSGTFTVSIVFDYGIEINPPSVTNGAITADKTNVASGGTVVYTITPGAGYEVDTFTVGGVDKKADISSNKYTATNVTANPEIVLTFKVKQVTLTYNAGTGGTISGSNPQTITYNTSGTEVTAVADGGYEFDGWSDGVATAARTDSNVTADKTVTANFKLIGDTNVYCNVSSSLTGNGTVSYEAPEGKVVKDSSLTITITPASGHRVKSFKINNGEELKDSIVSNEYTLTVSETIIITVEFEETPHVDVYTITPKEGTTDTLTVNYKLIRTSNNPSKPVYNAASSIDLINYASKGAHTHVILKITALNVVKGHNSDTQLVFQFVANGTNSGWLYATEGSDKVTEYTVGAINSALNLQIVSQDRDFTEGSFEIQITYATVVNPHVTLTPTGTSNEYSAAYYMKNAAQVTVGNYYYFPFSGNVPVSVKATVTAFSGTKSGSAYATPLIQLAVVTTSTSSFDQWKELVNGSNQSGKSDTVRPVDGNLGFAIIATGDSVSADRASNIYEGTFTVTIEIDYGVAVTTPMVSNGTINSSVSKVASGGSADFTVTPAAGYEVDTFTVDGTDKVSALSAARAGGTVTISGITATPVIVLTFKVKKVALTYAANNSSWGSITGTLSQEMDYGNGSNTLVTAVAESGYIFVRWSDGSENPVRAAGTDTNLTSDTVITAIFASEVGPVMHNVMITATGSGDLSLDGVEAGGGPANYQIEDGNTLTVTVTPALGDGITAFTVNGVDKLAELTANYGVYTISVVSGDITIELTFAALPALSVNSYAITRIDEDSVLVRFNSKLNTELPMFIFNRANSTDPLGILTEGSTATHVEVTLSNFSLSEPSIIISFIFSAPNVPTIYSSNSTCTTATTNTKTYALRNIYNSFRIRINNNNPACEGYFVLTYKFSNKPESHVTATPVEDEAGKYTVNYTITNNEHADPFVPYYQAYDGGVAPDSITIKVTNISATKNGEAQANPYMQLALQNNATDFNQKSLWLPISMSTYTYTLTATDKTKPWGFFIVVLGDSITTDRDKNVYQGTFDLEIIVTYPAS